MKRSTLHALAAGGLLGLLMSAVPAPASAATTVLANWEMNESSGASTMRDSSGNGRHGSIGDDVVVGVRDGSTTAYRWLFTSPTNPPAKPERLVIVPHHSSLNPGFGDYGIKIRYRTNQPFGNIIQKGQGGASGGYWKLENPGGRLTCVFRARAKSGSGWNRKEVVSPQPLNDNRWHTARCERIDGQLRLKVDGDVVDTANGSTGSIINGNDISIGGKSNCNQTSTTCDYYTGHIDNLQIYRPGNGGGNPPPPSNGTLFEDDFDSGNFNSWDKKVGMSIASGAGDASAPSARARVTNRRAFARVDFSRTTARTCTRVSLRVFSHSGGVDLLRLRTQGNAKIVLLKLNSAGRLVLKSDKSGQIERASRRLGSGWKRIRVCGAIGSGKSWTVSVNGNNVIQRNLNTGSAAYGRLQIGATQAETMHVLFDDVKVTRP